MLATRPTGVAIMRTTREQFWQQHVDSWRTSGLTQKQYGKKFGISPSTLAQWSHALKRKASNVSATALVPVRVIGDLPSARVEMQHGAWRIVVPVGTDAQWLSKLMREMAAC